jgi:hypothetical protein
MSNDFDAVFEPLQPRGTARLVLPGITVRGTEDVALIGMHAGRSNKGYTNAAFKLGKAMQRNGGKQQVEQLDDRDELFAKLFSKYVITGWENVLGSDGKPIPYTPAAGEAFLRSLGKARPGIAGLGGRIDLYFSDADNFSGDPLAGAKQLGEE